MTHSRHRTIHTQAVLSGLTIMIGLIFFVTWESPAQAQLSRCSSLQQQQLSGRCERPGMSSGSSLESLPFPGSTGSALGAGSITGLPDLAKPRPHYVPSDSILDPTMVPIDSLRDYLNRRDPADAIQPLQPLPPAAPMTGGNR